MWLGGCSFKEYSDRLAKTPLEFQEALEAFYNSHGKSVTPPVVGREQLDLFLIFKAVANLGGYQSVTFNRSVNPCPNPNWDPLPYLPQEVRDRPMLHATSSFSTLVA
jgi:hypothetical protein